MEIRETGRLRSSSVFPSCEPSTKVSYYLGAHYENRRTETNLYVEKNTCRKIMSSKSKVGINPTAE